MAPYTYAGYHPYTYGYHPYAYNYVKPYTYYANSGGAVHIILSRREKQRLKLTLIQMPGTDIMDTVHTPTDIDMATTDIGPTTHMPILATDMQVIIHIIIQVIIMENKFSDVHRIPDMATKRRE